MKSAGKSQSNPVTLAVYALSDVGIVRDNNEDSFLVVDTLSEDGYELPTIRVYPLEDTCRVLMVSDGMGGAAAGELASALAVRTIAEEMQCNPLPDRDQIQRKLTDSLHKANQVIAFQSLKQPGLQGMGATATTAAILKNEVFVAQVGDSRAYLIHENVITQMTTDQSLVNQLVEAGKITEEEAANHPRRNVILQALGNQTDLEVVVTHFPGDYLLLCSDGLTGQVSKEEIKEIVLESTDIREACREMVARVNQRGGYDNITVILARFEA